MKIHNKEKFCQSANFFYEFLLNMIQNITNIKTNNNYYYCPNNISFKQNYTSTLTHTNIGSCLEGYIGKVQVRCEQGGNVLLNVFKKLDCNIENYTIKNDKNDIIGSINLIIKKFQPNL